MSQFNDQIEVPRTQAAQEQESLHLDSQAMADPQNSSPLNPTAPTFSMPPQTLPNGTTTTPITNGPSKPQQQPEKPDKTHRKSPSQNLQNERPTAVNLTPAELKKQKAAEKAARRKEKVAEKGAQAAPTQQTQPTMPSIQRRPSGGRRDDSAFHRRTGSSSGRQLPLRPSVAEAIPKDKAKEEKRVTIFSHLSHPLTRKQSIAGTVKDVHPAVLALGLQLRDHVICGSTARCVATLLVFKKVIQAYDTPANTVMARHLTTHLSHQIAYIRRCRPLAISQGNGIRWLKQLIIALDPDLGDADAKIFLCEAIDTFIRERVTLADELIKKEASRRIVDGDVVLTYAKSSIVEKALLAAKKQGKRFTVIVVDSRPLFEGKNLAKSLSAAGISVQYSLLSGLADVVRNATKCFLGASAMTGNARLYSRIGTAMVAMMAKDVGPSVPVMVLCESIKFTTKVGLDSIMLNELGDPNSLVEIEQSETLTSTPPIQAPAPKGGKKGKEDDASEDQAKKGLEGWKDIENLHLLSLMYDTTPAEYLDIIITEMGSMPPSGVSVVNGVHGDEESLENP